MLNRPTLPAATAYSHQGRQPMFCGRFLACWIVIGCSATVVRADDAGFEARPLHFANDIVPLLSRHGCNSGGCHGRALGQNGFKLSLFGFDADFDYNAIVKEARGRRVFAAAPDSSLMLLKASGRV